MLDVFSLENLFTLLMLIALQAVLGFDNLLYISIESEKAPKEDQSKVRTLGIGIAIVLRIVLLFILVSVVELFQASIFSPVMGELVSIEGTHGEIINIGGILDAHFNVHSIIVLFGGGFIIYTAIKEIWHMISNEDVGEKETNEKKSTTSIITMIVLMNLVFSFDSILSAMALTSHIGDNFTEMLLMSTAIVGSGILMIVLAGRVATFLQKNRMYQVLGLFILFIVGIMLLTEGGHLAHIYIFGNPILPMSKTTFYFVIAALVIVDIIQSKYQKKLIAIEDKERDLKIN